MCSVLRLSPTVVCVCLMMLAWNDELTMVIIHHMSPPNPVLLLEEAVDLIVRASIPYSRLMANGWRLV